MAELVYTFEEYEAAPNETGYIVTAYHPDREPFKVNTLDRNDALQLEINLINAGHKKVLTHEQCNQLIAEWNQADEQQKFWREKELALRAALVAEKYTKDKGTERIELDAGWQLVIERGLDYKLENKNGETQDVVDDLPEEVANLLVRWKPEMQVKNFEAASEDTKAKFGAVLSIKPSSPSVKLVPPKASKE